MRNGRGSSAWQARPASAGVGVAHRAAGPACPNSVTRMTRAISWTRVGDREHGGEHLLLDEGSADGLVIAVDENRRPFRLAYRLTWDVSWRLTDARLVVTTQDETRTLQLESDGKGHWRDGEARALPELDGCIDIDIW